MNIKQILKDHLAWFNGKKDNGKANLYGANLYGANLRGANLYGADLCGANLYGADLCGANLRGANLYGADLCGANLRGADLRGANLYGANLRGANLYGAKGIIIFMVLQHFSWSYQYKNITYIQIGCIHKPVKEWVKQYKKIGKENKYTKEEIAMYGDMIKSIAKNFKPKR